jgi:hypothetical protein
MYEILKYSAWASWYMLYADFNHCDFKGLSSDSRAFASQIITVAMLILLMVELKF